LEKPEIIAFRDSNFSADLSTIALGRRRKLLAKADVTVAQIWFLLSRPLCGRDVVRNAHFGSRPGIRKGAASLPQMPVRDVKRWICIRANDGSRQMRQNRRHVSKEMRGAASKRHKHG